eukprot:scaffold27412_cov94-Skeletonema_dohrnii-CCMP3373.AAC.1
MHGLCTQVNFCRCSKSSMTLPRRRIQRHTRRLAPQRTHLGIVALFAIGAYFLSLTITIKLHGKTLYDFDLDKRLDNFQRGITSTGLGLSVLKNELHRPVAQILNNPKLPDWVKKYTAWHKQQRHKFFADMRANGKSDVRFLISRCLSLENCGGASDRLQDMPYNLILANQTNRVLLVRWEIPAKLEHFLVPQPDGINWTVPDDMFPEDGKGWNWNLNGKADSGNKIVSTIRSFTVDKFRQYEKDVVGHRLYHEIFRLLFSPSDALSIRWATNAVNCAAELHPNATIYVSSDNNDTVGYLLEESHFAQQYTDATKHKKHSSVVKLVARDYSSENQHINFSPNREVDGFMSVFEDLFIMGLGKCVAHGVGGYGRLAAALSGGECVMVHRGGNGSPNVCSNALKNIEEKRT